MADATRRFPVGCWRGLAVLVVAAAFSTACGDDLTITMPDAGVPDAAPPGGDPTPQVTVRHAPGDTSIEAMYDFRSAPYSGTPEEAALAWVGDNRDRFGIVDLSRLELRKVVPALGGYLVRFDQLDAEDNHVDGGGVSVVLTGELEAIAAFGPWIALTEPTPEAAVTADEAMGRARQHLASLAVPLSAEAAARLRPALDQMDRLVGPVKASEPTLRLVRDGAGRRLVWQTVLYHENPFGVHRMRIDARSGELVEHENLVAYQTADVFPTHPLIDEGLRDRGEVARGEDGRPVGSLRVELRGFHPTNLLTGVYDVLTGDHAVASSALAVSAPFSQAAFGTWHFAADNPPLEQGYREDVHYGPRAEPSQHQDAINVFFFLNYLVEYVHHLHVSDDEAEQFPDTYPNRDMQLPGVVHFPVAPGLLCDPTGDCPSPDDPAFADRMLGLDNAFSLPLSSIVGAEATNPTAYGHGYLYNNLAIEDGVPYHEGMHSISTPIAGFEGGAEAGALNEGQADLWAQTITGDPSLGEYAVNGYLLREAVRRKERILAAEGDPDLVGWIRNAQSGLLYSQLCRYNRATRAPDGHACEEHQDGEIYAAAMWDLRELLVAAYPEPTGVRPDLVTGAPIRAVSEGQVIWERLFLGSLWVLGAIDPDTFLAARDAVIVADAMLYPTVESAAPVTPIGSHRWMIEHVFAARELGYHARAPEVGRQTVSSTVSPFVGAVPQPRPPRGVHRVARKPGERADQAVLAWRSPAAPASGNTPRVLAYEIVKRRAGTKSGRLYPPDLTTTHYVEGDAVTEGWGHVDYLIADPAAGPNDELRYVDRGQIVGALLPRGIDPADFDYAVRTVAIDDRGRISVSDVTAEDKAPPEAITIDTEVTSGVVLVGLADAAVANGVDYVDVPIVGKPGSVAMSVTLRPDGSLVPPDDVDLYLYEVVDGELVEINSSAGFGPNESVTAVIAEGREYVARIDGWLNVATSFELTVEQALLASP